MDLDRENEYRGILQLAYQDYVGDLNMSAQHILDKLIVAFNALESERV
jgi:hypothetical protein